MGLSISPILLVTYALVPLSYIEVTTGLYIPHLTSCNKNRTVLTQPWGIISHGPGGANYTQDSHCQWLIKANNSEQFITLRFLSLATECSYDYVFIYDGYSFNSRLLGSFSGRTQPEDIIASSGYMLILLYSDTNYVLDGFRAEYSVTNCRANCSDQGACMAGVCICNDDWTGEDCSMPVCSPKTATHLYCLKHNTTLLPNRWRKTRGVITARAAHSGVYVPETDSLYVFGGYDLNDYLGDMFIYSFKTGRWEDEKGTIIHEDSTPASHLESKVLTAVISNIAVKPGENWGLRPKTFFQHVLYTLADNRTHKAFERQHDGKHWNRARRESGEDEAEQGGEEEEETLAKPSPRHSHASSQYKGGFVIHGGETESGSSGELWYFSAEDRRWSLRATRSRLSPPPLARHTLTLAYDHWLYILGGIRPDGLFSSAIFRIKLSFVGGTEEWEVVRTRGGKSLDVRLAGHTTVYHPSSGLLVAYGGLMTSVARFSILSDRVFTFHTHAKTWASIDFPRLQLRDNSIPHGRAFHTAIRIGNYMVVFGGYIHKHNRDEVCYDNQLYLYHLVCHTWISNEILGPVDTGSSYPKRQGMFAHSAALRDIDKKMITFGGYHGSVNNDLLFYAFPPTLARVPGDGHEPEQLCARHKRLAECTADPECGWCTAPETCYGRTLGVNCTTNLLTTRCPGICPALDSCQSCLTQSSSIALSQGQCVWCVHNAKCRHIHDMSGVCGISEETPSQIAGWWGDKGVEVMNATECKDKDQRPGLTFIKYKHPPNMTQPDYVGIVNSTTVEFTVGGGTLTRTEQALGGSIISRLKGFLRIPQDWASSREDLIICSSYSSASLMLGYGNSSLEVVGNLTAESGSCRSVSWPGQPPEPGGVEADRAVSLRPGRYQIDYFVNKSVTASSSSQQQTKMEIAYNKTSNKTSDSHRIFTFEYLESYSGGEPCSNYTNCLACLTDSKCGWCPLTDSCLERTVNETAVCQAENEWHYLTLVPSVCNNCSNYITCDSCIKSGICEWWPDEAKCARIGRSQTGIKAIDDCPASCNVRKNCTHCLDGYGRCVWCQATQECFSFSVYTSQYQFGKCREWIDLRGGQTNEELCRPCSAHANCSTCLKTLSCGWCYDLENPIVGVCTPGDFSSPASGGLQSCAEEVNRRHNMSLYPDEASWSYALCPDVDECGLGLHDCHPQAKCTNTHGSYNCQCKRGYIGDGKKYCTRTCYNKCVHGYCVGDPDYTCKCELGWYGVDCSINCGCNNHSTCTKGVNQCDECKDWTTGEFCQFCKPGSYGNATSIKGCQKCNCNDHGDQALGICDHETGVCYCKDNTMGTNCDKCKKGYYGDPRRGGTCYYQCMSRGMVDPKESRGLGSRLAEMSVWESRQDHPPTRECLWILGNNSNQENSEVVELTIDGDIQVPCTENSVYVYDGLPKFVSSSGNQQSSVLGVFCSQDPLKNPVTVQAKSGVMTVHYKMEGESKGGFNATISILSCPDNCPSTHICLQGQCVCPPGGIGPHCRLISCPKNCSGAERKGRCDKEYGRCLCHERWGKRDCSVRIYQHQMVFTELFNSALLSDSLDHLRKMLPRFGHSLLAEHSSSRGTSLWMFAGYSLSHGPLNDIRLFDTKNSTWMQVTIDSTNDAHMPRGRYFHAAEISQLRKEIYVHGGLTSAEATEEGSLQNATLSDFWKFRLKPRHWVEIEMTEGPPGLAGHTLTLRKEGDKETLVLIGGFSPEQGFLDRVWEFDLETEKWEKMTTSGAGPIGVYGHSTVYHTPTDSFYLFGGYVYGVNRTYISDKLYVLHYPTKSWSPLPTFSDYSPIKSNRPRLPSGRFLHSAITTDEYMVVFGGRTEVPSMPEPLVAYIYACNHWVLLSDKEIEIVGEIPPETYSHAMALDADASSDKQTIAYIMGGFTGRPESHVTRITIPSDLCTLRSTLGKDKCRGFLGCSFCRVTRGPGDVNTSACYSSHLNAPSDPCQSLNGTVRTSNGLFCNVTYLSLRTCSQFTTCSDCLAKWPTEEEPACKWCGTCGGGGKCIRGSDDCAKDAKCGPREISSLTYCPELTCPASDCDKCMANPQCLWTRQAVKTSDEGGVMVSGEPVYNWNCVARGISDRSSLKIKAEPTCPKRCHELSDCQTCLQSQGGEGDWSECRWSTKLSECISPSYQNLVCAGSVCGLVLSRGAHCPQPCAAFQRCSECLKHAHCGWCSLTSQQGEGVCSEGSLDHPATGPESNTCEGLYALKTGAGEASADNSSVIGTAGSQFSWHYVSCPPEDECAGGRHSCDPLSELCVDQEDGYKCICAKGYIEQGGECVPVCSQGCVRGKCTAPDTCKCDFGYVGANCSIQCLCHGHSDCAGPDRLDECLDCKNNTQGPQCSRCKPLFVGDPTENVECIPCSDYCNGHTNICVNHTFEDYFNHTFKDSFILTATQEELEGILREGPTSNASCIGCMNMTRGAKCEQCLSGHFRGTEDLRASCRPCQCHGHGDTCDPVTGEKCNCGNNTESDSACSGKMENQCWALQCSKCKESFMGTPTGGHQCYRGMTVDLKFCLDAKIMDECKLKPKPLSPGQTVFFVVQPRFMNVDIRITLDITQGALDMFISPKDDTFVVETNSSSGRHLIKLDPKYKLNGDGPVEFEAGMNISSPGITPLGPGRLETVVEEYAGGLASYITLRRNSSILIVRNLTDRLVITLPQDVHDLGTTRFFIALAATTQPAYGMIFFRQDQLHIDLFVFFSVFFSCFFLFLAVCVVAWKAKQAADIRRARRLHVVEMLHMAKRPFARVTLMLGGGPEGGGPRPVAIEPTEDGLAAVGTVLVRLPGGRAAPVQLAIASSLVLLSRVCPTNNRPFLRRRSVIT